MTAKSSPTKKNMPPNQHKELLNLVESVKQDNLVQYGEIKKEFGGVTTRLDSHDNRIKGLERDKIERDAIEKYKKEHPEVAQKVFDDGQRGYNNNDGSVRINKELLTALKVLGGVILTLAAAIAAMKVG